MNVIFCFMEFNKGNLTKSCLSIITTTALSATFFLFLFSESVTVNFHFHEMK